MINLDDFSIQEYQDEYLNLMIGDILTKFVLPLAPYLATTNKFTDNSVFDFFKNNSSDLDAFFKDILVMKIPDLINKYPEVKNYFHTAKFSLTANEELSEKLSDIKSRDYVTREKIRKDILSKYENIPWIQKIKIQHSEYYKSTEKYKLFVKDVNDGLEKLNACIRYIVNYDDLSDLEKHKLKYIYGVEVCPYCNRNFISKYEEDGTWKSTADLDHYYPKSAFSLFALSLYNFIPSCQVCNSRFKLDKGTKIIHPYLDKVDYSKFKFNYSLTNDSDINIFIGDTEKFNIVIECSDEEYLSHINLFKLKELYNSHKLYVSEILYKRTAFNDSYLETTNNFLGKLNISQNEKDILLYGIEMNEESFYKKPLSKLTYDLIKNERL